MSEPRIGWPLCPACNTALCVTRDPVNLDAIAGFRHPLACGCGWHGTDWVSRLVDAPNDPPIRFWDDP